ncbi:S8 family serine peptidase [Mesomycoplasma ovipneumoniae]|uniref:S8 family serine peptidase n=1 Tax=Mesomycoplasma ovipneumoniae TaxID=29562 RepID=UPI0028AEF648|nr:S8 family serine peptidase [Mesomycoplasma ovipneumoniae]WNM13453.1 S8 family serine peptidase [Mesomycoplasma ovipneumoniae]
MFGFASIPLIYISLFINWNNNKQYWYSTNFSNKIDVRDPFIKKLNKSSKVENLDNNFELKLLLDPDFLDTEPKKITSFNIDFLEKMKKLNLKYKETKYSQMLPIVWFYFDTENDREFFVKNSLKNSTVSRFIVYKNEEKDKQTGHVEILDDNNPLNNNDNFHSLFRKSLNENISIVNFQKQAPKDSENQDKTTSKVGVIEFLDKFDSNFNIYFNENQLNINDLVSNRPKQAEKPYHSTLVSLILGGKAGVDKKSDLYLSIFKTDAEWQKAIEWMATNDVRVINHSYGNKLVDFKDYNENTYLLDFLARKYGVINVFAAGNGADKIDEDEFGKNKSDYNPWIDDRSLSLNSIVVGALQDNSSNSNIAKNEIAPYSNFKIGDQYVQFAKPLVVAPGQIYNVLDDKNQSSQSKKYVSGTSYAAPVITGLISTFLREILFVRDDFRVPAIKSILSVSAIVQIIMIWIKKIVVIIKSMGLEPLILKKMKKAVDNQSFIFGNKENEGEVIFTGNRFWVNANETIKSSLSWNFNAGMLKNNETGQNISGWWWFLPAITRNVSHDWLPLEATKKRQGGTFVSDYDLYLQKLNSNGDWVDVARSNSILSNDELIDFKSNESAYYRIYVKNYKSSVFENSEDDRLVVSYLVHNEN